MIKLQSCCAAATPRPISQLLMLLLQMNQTQNPLLIIYVPQHHRTVVLYQKSFRPS
uniref:Uncharacterized protein n=1 Tax=Rhizophora mucronata TaxID=61149 RepID=A0A2P2P751_RHIMU